MSKNIVITGGLGYIGTELSKIYSGESWNSNITVIDKRFISERVNQLRKWRINFVQADILDKEKINQYLKNADVVHHLAGITDVAYVKSDINEDRDKLIRDTAIEGTQNIINSVSNNCKIIFPSTHVVFEGLKETMREINEDHPTSTFLAYSTSKVKNEEQLKASNKNYVILRLGSVYGYSSDTMRINIMPNLFSKMTSQEQTIKLFSGGKQLKSLVPLIDVARCFKFMEENIQIKKETFHLSKDSITVSEVADLCKKYNPNLVIEKTQDEIPNLGYTLSNKKLLKTGFKFLYSLDQSIKEMIDNWSKSKDPLDLEYIKEGEKEFIDARGKISNHELPEPINLIGYIDSVKGSVRANHYHPIQEQKCLLVKGQFISVYQDLLNINSPKITHVVNEGNLIVTKPNTAHAMVFTKDSIFLNLVRGEREHENYGVTHTIRKVIVDEDIRKKLISIYKFDCRCCGNESLKRVISLGFQPLANNLENNNKTQSDLYPLEMNYCENCHNCQLSVTVDPKKMFSNYLYLSSTSKQFVKHFDDASDKYIKKFKLIPKKSNILDIGSNDGIALKPFKDKGFKNLLGIEPASNLAKEANKNKIKTLNYFFDKKILNKINKKFDLILASNVFAHSDKLKEMAECMSKLIKPNGIIVIEVQYLLNTLKDLTFDNIYHEHYNYWSLTSLKYFFNSINLHIIDAELIDTHGGSIRVFVSKTKKTISNELKKLLKEEENYGIKQYKTYQVFADRVYKLRTNVRKNLAKIANGNKLIAYGSPAKATTALNFFGIDYNNIDFIVEDNKLKNKKYLPGVKIPITNDKTKIKPNSKILVLAWNFFDYIKQKNEDLNCKFINIKELEKE